MSNLPIKKTSVIDKYYIDVDIFAILHTSANASLSIWLIRFSLRSKRRTPRTFLNACDLMVSIEAWVNFKSSNSKPNSRKSSACNRVVDNFPSDSERSSFNLKRSNFGETIFQMITFENCMNIIKLHGLAQVL